MNGTNLDMVCVNRILVDYVCSVLSEPSNEIFRSYLVNTNEIDLFYKVWIFFDFRIVYKDSLVYNNSYRF